MAFGAFFTEGVLPFMLVFVVVFAILQKSKILGENKQVDALTALVIGLLLVALPAPRTFIVEFMPWVAVGIAVILVFLLLYGFVAGQINPAEGKHWMKYTFGILAALFVIGVILYVTGFWQTIVGWISGTSVGEGVWLNIIVIVAVIALMWFAVKGSKPGTGGGATPAGH